MKAQLSGLIARLSLPPGSRVRRRGADRLALLLLAIVGLSTLRELQAIQPPEVYNKDLHQEWLLARAVLHRENPYLPLPELGQGHLPGVPVQPQRGLHPPFVALAAVPLGLVPYEAAAGLWLGVELVLLLLLARLLLAGGPGPPGGWTVVCTASVLLLWTPVLSDLYFGQLSLTLAVLVVGSWLTFKSGRWRLAGALLGASIAVKLFPAVLVGYFLLRKQWGTVAWAAGTATALSALGGLAVGADGVRSYILASLPEAAYWRAAEVNHSVFAAVWRVFAGSIRVMPLVDLPWAAWPLAALASLAALALAAWAILRANDPDAEFATALCAMLLASPIVWAHYEVLLLWPIFTLGKRLRARSWPRLETRALILAVLAMAIPVGGFFGLMWAIAGERPEAPGQVVPPLAGIPLLLLPAGPLLLFWLLLRETSAPSRAGDQT